MKHYDSEKEYQQALERLEAAKSYHSKLVDFNRTSLTKTCKMSDSKRYAARKKRKKRNKSKR